MQSLALCLLALAATFATARRSLVAGLGVALGIGYAYGIARANLQQTASHFLFDAAALGLFAAALFRLGSLPSSRRLLSLKNWLIVLSVWPLILFLLPIQNPLVQLVGLRGNIFFLPFLLVGAALDGEDWRRLATWIACLNLVAFAFAGAEYVLGIERFFPYSAVTDLIYRSNDLVGYTAHRIPSIFTSAHAYAGTMVITLPLLLSVWNRIEAHDRLRRLYFGAAVAVSVLGVFLAAARVHAAILLLLLAYTVMSSHLRASTKAGWVVVLIPVALIVASEERLQRFTSLRFTDQVVERVAGSVNAGFVDLVKEYPLGNGLGGGGTSIPYFLQNRLRNPISMENEYARIVLEQGLPGLALWIGFMLWVVLSPAPRTADPWILGRAMCKVALTSYFGAAVLGVGLLTSIPQSAFLLLLSGWLAAPLIRRRESPSPTATPAPPLSPAVVPVPEGLVAGVARAAER